MSSQEDFADLISTIEDNLEEMGVEDATFNSETGLMGLVDKILDIKAGGIVETSISNINYAPKTNNNHTVGDDASCGGILKCSIDNLPLRIEGATVYFYNNDDLIGTDTTNASGSFTIIGHFHKASNEMNYIVKFLGTDSLSPYEEVIWHSDSPVNKKSIVLPQNIPDDWYLTLGTYTANIGAQYQDAPISLHCGDGKYGTETVDANGQVSFDLRSQGIVPSSNQWQLVVETNDVYSNAQSNVFTVNIGVNIDITRVTVGKRIIKGTTMALSSNKDILSYADGDTATITAQLQNANGQNLLINGEDIKFTIPKIRAEYKPYSHGVMPSYGIYLGDSYTIPIEKNKQVEFVLNNFLGTVPYIYIGYVPSTKEFTISEKKQNGQTETLFSQTIAMNESDSTNYDVSLDSDSFNVYINENEISFLNETINIDYNLLYLQEGGFVEVNGIDTVGVDFEFLNVSRNVTTDNNGQASITYTSSGIGDVSIDVSLGNLVSKTFSLCDAYKYDGTEHSESFGTSSVNKTITEYPNSSDYSVEMDVLCTGNYYFTNCSATSNDPSGSKIGYGTSGTGYIFTLPTGSAYGSQITSYYHIKWVRESNTMKMYLNDVLIDTCTDNAVSTLKYLTISSWGSSKTVYYKNVLIKPL